MILSLDLSTTNSGWAKFSLKRELVAYGEMAPKVKNPVVNKVPKYTYPEIQLLKMRDLVDQLLTLLTDDLEKIVIEEINRGKNRLGQKTLDGLHWLLLDRMPQKFRDMVVYVDSDGASGWRSKEGLALQLSPLDKEKNKEIRKFNKKHGFKNGTKNAKPLITQKTLACKYVNKRFGLSLDENKRTKDADIADAIGLGDCYLMWRKM